MKLRHQASTRKDGETADFGTISFHVRELGKRVMWVLGGIALGTILGWVIYPYAFDIIQRPLLEAGDAGNRLTILNFPYIGSALSTKLKLSLFLGFLISLPWTAWQIGVFVWPGLRTREKRLVVILLASMTPLFILGMTFGWLCLPATVSVMADFAPSATATMISAEDYLNFVVRILVACGCAFLLPVIMVGLTMMSFVTAARWLKGWRIAVVVAAVFAALASPSGDVATLALLASPIIILYFAAIGVGASWEWWQVHKIMRGDRLGLWRRWPKKVAVTENGQIEA